MSSRVSRDIGIRCSIGIADVTRTGRRFALFNLSRGRTGKPPDGPQISPHFSLGRRTYYERLSSFQLILIIDIVFITEQARREIERLFYGPI